MNPNLHAVITTHFRADQLRSIDVPEWGASDEAGQPQPLKLWFRPATLNDLAEMNQPRRGLATTFDRSLWLVVRKAADATGALLFTSKAEVAGEPSDEELLRDRADPFVINRIAVEILNSVAPKA